MKYYQSIFLLAISALFLCGYNKQTTTLKKTTENRCSYSDGNLSVSPLSSYEVRFTYTGYTSFGGSLPDCPIRSNGTVKLAGVLVGNENVATDDDIVYTGSLQLDIDMDICSIKNVGDQAKFCSITVTGSGTVKTELEIYYDGRGGYIQIRDTTSSGFRKNAVGTCDLAEIAEERTMIPLKTIASIFNGLDLPMLTQRTLRTLQVGQRYKSQIAEGEVAVEVLRVVTP
jgi:hypothetical protein